MNSFIALYFIQFYCLTIIITNHCHCFLWAREHPSKVLIYITVSRLAQVLFCFALFVCFAVFHT